MSDSGSENDVSKKIEKQKQKVKQMEKQKAKKKDKKEKNEKTEKFDPLKEEFDRLNDFVNIYKKKLSLTDNLPKSCTILKYFIFDLAQC